MRAANVASAVRWLSASSLAAPPRSQHWPSDVRAPTMPASPTPSDGSACSARTRLTRGAHDCNASWRVATAAANVR